MSKHKIVENIITLEYLIKELCPNIDLKKYINNNKNIEELKNGDSIKFDISEFKIDCDENFFRKGVIKNLEYPKKVNFSFFGCLIYLLFSEKQVEKYIDKEAQMLIVSIKNKMINDINKQKIYRDNKYHINYRWKKKDLVNSLNSNNVNRILFKYAADYFNINIWILDKNTKKIRVYSPYEKYKINIYYNHIIVCKNNKNDYSPIVTSKKIFDFNDKIIKEFINHDKCRLINASQYKEEGVIKNPKVIKLRYITDDFNNKIISSEKINVE